ncbi:DUF3105 domain-containing protein [Actinocrispum wychmicini]|uniref:Uncharacterized protein DUF3105 n=1 Tax=Actinocrispum wychmicini TaxID=1213861 RepID=A0A4R2JFL1_9PSEU|nr:DUF3105 domain-containing protein [Actinocrispum wychmicini]TCO57387.1 uncharacterized protein DUF3105 [Actinocrispum wychmicini]
MASGTKSRSGGSKGSKGKGVKSLQKASRSASAVKKPKPWGTIGIIVALVVVAAVVFGYAITKINAANAWKPSDSNKDPSKDISGVVKVDYPNGIHVNATQRVAYDQAPPFGGPHDGVWANCDGMVYANPVRSENMVHMLEHGAVWIAYNPDKVKGADLDKLKAKVTGQDFIAISPYPGLDRPFSLQSWGHQLKLDTPDDERVDEFIKSLKRNTYTFPEPGATCDTIDGFDPTNPPPFNSTPLPPDAVKMDGTGATKATMQNGQEAPPSSPGAPPAGAPVSGASSPPPSTKPSQ